MIDLMILNGTLLTMDPQRRIIENGVVAVDDGRIVAAGALNEVAPGGDAQAAFPARRVIDAGRMVVMPGLIDAHAHAGHAIVKSLGADLLNSWNEACFRVYQQASDEDFWYSDALLSGLERVKCGTTTSLNMLGGGDTVMRTDDAVYGQRHCEAIEQVGIREFLAVGPGKPPFPRRYGVWHGETRRDVMVTFEQQLAASEEIVRRCHGAGHGRVQICMTFPTLHPGKSWSTPAELDDLKVQAAETRALGRKYGLLFTQDGHARGTVKFAHAELDILGPDSLLAHSIDLTAEEIAILRETDTRIAHNPSAIMSILGRCPVPELLDAGVTVAIGSDGVGPDRSYDMFRHMFQLMRYHRTYYRDPEVLPPGKALEMATIDAARAFGLDKEIGSLEVGKKADIILINLAAPHLAPINMPAYRVAYYAVGSDVHTTIVDGKILMENRQVQTVDEFAVLERAQQTAERMIRRADLEAMTALPQKFWGHSRY